MRAAKSIATAVLVLSGLLAASQASAQGFYIGGSVGQSNFDDSNAIPDLITSGNVDSKDTGYKIFGGYQFNQHFGLELAWVDLGKASYSGTFLGAPVTGGTVETSASIFPRLASCRWVPTSRCLARLVFRRTSRNRQGVQVDS